MKRKKLKKGMVCVAVALALVTGISVVPNTTPSQTQVEAAGKKDKKKPTFKMSGETTITVEKAKSIKIPKVTAKDNKDGNVTKKISVTVKKGKKSYSSIAKKIKNNKKVKFTEAGKYTVTYSVKDKAGNKATKKRYVVVTEPKGTDDKTSEATSENKTSEATTEEKKPETPTVDLSIYGDIEQVVVDGVKYNILKNPNEEFKANVKMDYGAKIKFYCEKGGFNTLYYDFETKDYVTNYDFFAYFGEIYAYDSEGNDISKNIFFLDKDYKGIKNSKIYTVCGIDSKGDLYRQNSAIEIMNEYTTLSELAREDLNYEEPENNIGFFLYKTFLKPENLIVKTNK